MFARKLLQHDFKGRLKELPYTFADAISYASWVKSGWDTGSNFAFIVRDTLGNFVGTLDIKSPDLNNAEVGCWADQRHPGFMTGAMKELVCLAGEAGFSKLFARVKPENLRSLKMVERVGFKKIEERVRGDGRVDLIYEISCR